jgi:uncharacterized protein with von Willebrand factor type A (vWA) domain
MANFKAKRSSSAAMKPMLNHEGAVVHKMNDLEVLFSKTLGSFFGEGTYYEDRSASSAFVDLYERVQRIPEKDKEYVLKIAELGRLCNMMEYPIQLFVAACNTEMFLGNGFIDEATGRNKLQTYADRILTRAKDATNAVSTQFALPEIFDGVEKGLPMQLKKSLKNRLEKFDMFQLSKGLSKNKNVSLKDVISLVRPKPRNEEYAAFFKEILLGNVKSGVKSFKAGEPDEVINMQSAFSKQGKSESSLEDVIGVAKKETLQNLVKNFAALYEKGAFENDELLDIVCNRLSDAKEVERSKLLPFRFYSAHDILDKRFGNAINKVRRLKKALRTALDLSIVNMPRLEGATCVLIDLSGSMDYPVSKNSSVKAIHAAAVLGALAYKCGSGDIFAFSDQAVRVKMSEDAPAMDLVDAILNATPQGGTNLNAALKAIDRYAKEKGACYDNLILISDNDCYGYNRQSDSLTLLDWNGNANDQIDRMLKSGTVKKLWINNLLGNEFAVFNTNQHTKNLATGYSEKFFEVINAYSILGSGADIKGVIDEQLSKRRRRTL